MELLLSNYPPMKTKCRTFSDMFYSMVPKSTELDIAVGYITSDSLMELQRIVELNTLKALNLTIGMHYLERFTKVEYNAALKLNDFLTENKCGEVRLVTPFRYHGKLYSYSDEQGAFAGIIGSNNLSSIVEGGTRVYESAVFLDDKNMACQINNFIRELVQTSTGNIRDLHIDNFREVNPLLEGHEFVKRVDPHEVAEVMLQRTNISFDIPIKPYEVSPQSNLNAFFGKGREAKTDDAIFDVITDDGWSFKCKVSGDYSKNFRSEGDLKILGKWLKGRLENAGVLKVGDPVTKETLELYGRDTFTLTKTIRPGIWYLDFGVVR